MDMDGPGPSVGITIEVHHQQGFIRSQHVHMMSIPDRISGPLRPEPLKSSLSFSNPLRSRPCARKMFDAFGTNSLFHLFLKWSSQLEVVLACVYVECFSACPVQFNFDFSTVPIRSEWICSPCRACVSANPRCSIGPETAPADFHGEKCAAWIHLLSQHSWHLAIYV